MLHITPSSIPLAFQTATQHYNAGNLSPAHDICRQILTLDPNHFQALHMSALVLLRTANPAAALTLFQQLHSLQPNSAEILHDLALTLQFLSRHAEAAAEFRKAIALQPHFPRAYDGLGNALTSAGEHTAAIDAFIQAITQQPNFAQAWSNMGNAFLAADRLPQAIDAYTRATQLLPKLPQPHLGLGVALLKSKKIPESLATFQHVLALDPNLPEAHNNLASALIEAEDLQLAIASCRRALELRPNYPEAHSNLGNALRKQDKLEEAVASYRQAIALRPAYPEAIANLASALISLSQFDEASMLFRRVLEVKPDFAAQNLLFCIQFLPNDDPELNFREHAKWNARHAAPLVKDSTPHTNDRSPNRRLRIGYVSPDFRDHCQSFFTIPTLSNHNHTDFEIFLYADIARPDSLTDRIRNYADTWRDTKGLTDPQLAALIRNDQIDILIDLTMHMANGRPGVFARKPAPIQIAWLAYPGTTGLTAIDYRLSDPNLDPPPPSPECNDRFYSETTLRLPDTFWCYDPLENPNDFPVSPLPALTNNHFTFACLNNFSKVNDRTLNLWSKTLQAIPNSRFLLLAPAGPLRETLLEKLRIDPSRIELITRQPRKTYLNLYRNIDLCLDTFPYNGHTTSLDALWMGVPPITLPGRTAVSRAGLSQMTNLNLPQFIAKDENDYIQIAKHFSKNLPTLAQLRQSLRPRMTFSPLMNAPLFTQNLESTYRTLWQNWCESSVASWHRRPADDGPQPILPRI